MKLLLFFSFLFLVTPCMASKSISGVEALCLNSALSAFKKDYQGRYKLSNYDILIEARRSDIRVDFVPRRTPADIGRRGGRNPLGVGIGYIVSLKNYKIIDRRFYR